MTKIYHYLEEWKIFMYHVIPKTDIEGVTLAI